MKKRRTWIILTIVLLLLVAGGGYAAYRGFFAKTEEVEQPTLKTATVTQGDIINSVDGSGQLIPSTELDLAFRASGTLSEVLVQVGDEVQEGDLLARLDTDDLERELAQAEADLQIAELDYAEAQEGATDAELADASASLRSAQAELKLAQDAYNEETTNAPEEDHVVKSAKLQYDYYVGYFQKRKSEFESGDISQTDYDHAMNAMISAEGRYQDAINDAKAGDVEAQDRLTQARNSVYQASQKLQELESEPLTETLVSAQLTVDEAAMTRAQAAADLEAAELYAPFSGTVMDISGEKGELANTETSILTLATMQEPVVQFWVEESDMDGVQVGYTANIVFDALPDDVFTGTVTRIAPEMTEVSGMAALEAWTSLDLGEQDTTLLSGMTADVEVISAQSTGALLVPLEALRESASGEYSVVVQKSDGTLETRAVTVGLKSATNAEILDGLELGETVVIE